MKMRSFAALALAITSGPAIAAPVPTNPLVGAYRLVAIETQQPDGKMVRQVDLKGSLIYSPAGRLSVQVLYPDATVSSDYVSGGYEASFGAYEVDTRRHRVVHHVEGANVRSLIGSNLVRVYELSGRRLTIRSAKSDEHWSVTWERV